MVTTRGMRGSRFCEEKGSNWLIWFRSEGIPLDPAIQSDTVDGINRKPPAVSA